MGEIYKYKCECGYEEKLNLGGGLMSCNLMQIARFFPKEVEALKEARQRGELENYMMENRLGVCHKCNKLTVVLEFRFKTKSKVNKYITNCEMCNGKVEVIGDEDVNCPKCNKLMMKEYAGNWD